MTNGVHAFRSTYYLPHSYSMGQIIKPVCVRVSIRLWSFYFSLFSLSHFLIDFHQNWHRRKKLQSKNEFVGVNIKAPPLPPFCLFPENPILGQGVLKIHATISNTISALNVRESPKFPRFEEIWVEEGDGDDRVYTGSRNMAVSRMRNENIQYNR